MQRIVSMQAHRHNAKTFECGESNQDCVFLIKTLDGGEHLCGARVLGAPDAIDVVCVCLCSNQ